MAHTAEKIDDPERAVTRLMECLVIAFALDEAAGAFTLITDCPDKAPGADRSFLALCFGGVRDFRREAGGRAELQQFRDAYRIGAVAGASVVQAVRSTAAADHRVFELWLGPGFGGISFTYRALAGSMRHARAEARGGTWIYRDARSGEEFDFTEPFADLMPCAAGR